jgi:hypothetical protein
MIDPGSIWRKQALGSVAVYEVVADHGDLIEVEVRAAPGIPAGTRIRFAPEAFSGMELVPQEESQERRAGGRARKAFEGPEPAGT